MDAKKKNMQPTKKGNFTNTSGVSMRQTGGYGNGNGGSRREGSGTDQVSCCFVVEFGGDVLIIIGIGS